MPSVVGQITKGAVFDVLVDADSVGGDAGANTLPDATVAASNVTQHVGVIDHDLLLNFLATEHYAESTIDHTAITNIGTNSHATLDTAALAAAVIVYSNVLDAPFMFDDRPHWKRFMSTKLVKGWVANVEKKGGITLMGDYVAFPRGSWRVES